MTNLSPETIPADEHTAMHERLQKLAALRQSTSNAFPNDFHRDDFASTLHTTYGEKSNEEFDATPSFVRVAGRMMLKRVMGKAAFATLQDSSGRIQLYLSGDHLDPDLLQAFKHWDLGDIVGAAGTLFKTRTGELTVKATELRLLTKSLRPLPEKFHGLTDTEQKYRQRYLDLLTNSHAQWIFVTRSKIIQAIRMYMVDRGYLEVETPMMHPIPGGANARPFVTHHNALDRSLYLRIAPELYLKRLVVGGFERVFEINRNFRNEGVSARHSPEFTMMEFYEAYRDYQYYMDFTEQLLQTLAQQIHGTSQLTYQGKPLDLSSPFKRYTITEAIAHYHPQYTAQSLSDPAFLRTELSRLGSKPPTNQGIGQLQLHLFEETTEHLLWEPTYIVDYPAETSPLARRKDSDPTLTDRFELFIAGRELANGFSELNDAQDQAERFAEQAQAKDTGDDEAMHFDADYIRALEYGLPPTAGQGIGIDRLVMLLTDAASIRDVILFPHMRPE